MATSTKLVTIGEFVVGANPPISDDRMTGLVLLLGVEPAKHRRTGQAGRPVRLFEMDALADVHKAVAPWLRKLNARNPVRHLPGVKAQNTAHVRAG
jgi:hypothetical protein